MEARMAPLARTGSLEDTRVAVEELKRRLAAEWSSSKGGRRRQGGSDFKGPWSLDG